MSSSCETYKVRNERETEMTKVVKIKTMNNKAVKMTITKIRNEVVSVEIEPWTKRPE
jgi:hypothetical protein